MNNTTNLSAEPDQAHGAFTQRTGSAPQATREPPRRWLSMVFDRVGSGVVCGEYGAELVDECDGERSVVGWDCGAVRVVGEYEYESTDLAALARDCEF
jgi:hypothetical protein